jgi:cell shape-determining protein MreD
VGLAQVFHLLLVIPSLVFIVCLSFALERDSNEFFFWALLGGLWMDFYSGDFVGTFAVAFLVTMYLVHIIVTDIVAVEVNWKLLSVSVAGSLALLYLIIWGYSYALVRLTAPAASMVFRPTWHGFIIELIADLILVYPVFLFADWLKATVRRLLYRHQDID